MISELKEMLVMSAKVATLRMDGKGRQSALDMCCPSWEGKLSGAPRSSHITSLSKLRKLEGLNAT